MYDATKCLQGQFYEEETGLPRQSKTGYTRGFEEKILGTKFTGRARKDSDSPEIKHTCTTQLVRFASSPGPMRLQLACLAVHSFIHSTNIYGAPTVRLTLCYVLGTQNEEDKVCSPYFLVRSGKQ